MPHFSKKPRNNRDRNRFETRHTRYSRRLRDEATSIYVRNLPASADKQSLHDWCQRTVCKDLDVDGEQRYCEGIIKDIWIAKPVAIKSEPGIDGKTQKLRYAHVRFQHGYFKRLMMARARPEEFDGVSKPEIQRWKSKATRHNGTDLGQRDGDLEKKATFTSSKEGSSSSSEAVERAVEQ